MVDTQAGETVRVHFIRDEPADKDFFNTHTQLANAIVGSIEHNSEIKVVGLLGRWGSGKSTVTKKIVEGLEASGDSKFSVFTYDAWLHQSDPIRRSFLESLLRFLKTSIEFAGSSWNDRLKELNGEIQDTDVVETPTLSADARWFLSSLLPVPIGLALIDLDTIENAFGASTTQAGVATFQLACALILTPLWAWLLHYLIRRPCKNGFWPKNSGLFSWEFWRIVDDAGRPTSLLPLFLNRSVTRTSTRTLRSADPTSLEFARAFQAIMKEATKDKRRFVIIIDNLDRVAIDEALQMWATIRSFFLAAHEGDDFAHEPYHPTVILPIDRHAIEQMFKVDAGDDKLQARDRAASFISKTFDVTFEVTEPVASDWRAFLDQQMKAVFGEYYDPDWSFWTRRLFEQRRSPTQTVVTPREINKLVNRVAALFVQWHREGIAVEVMALYVICRDVIDPSLIEFLHDSDPGIARQVPAWKRQLAALHYGVPVNKAAQVLLEAPMRASIRDLDRDEFATLSHIDGFGEIFEMITADLPPASDGAPADFAIVSNASLLLSAIEQPMGRWTEAAWSNLIDAFVEVRGPAQPPADFAARLTSLLPHVAVGREKPCVTQLSGWLGTLLSAERLSPLTMRSIVAAANITIDFARSSGIELPLFNLSLMGASFIQRIAQIGDSRVANQVRTRMEGSELQSAILEIMGQASDRSPVEEATRILSSKEGAGIYAGKGGIDWTPVAEQAESIIRDGSTPAWTHSSIHILAYLANRDEGVRKQLAAMIDDGILGTRADAACAAKEWAPLQRILALLIWHRKNFDAPNGSSWAGIMSDQPDFMLGVLAKLRQFFPDIAMNRVWGAHSAAYSARPLLEAMIQHMIEKDDMGRINVQHVLDHLSFYRTQVPWRLRDRFMALIEQRGTFWEKLEQAPLGESLQQAATALAKKGEAEAARIREIVLEKVQAADVEAWTGALKTGAQPLELATKFLGTEALKMNAGSALYQALVNNIGLMCTVAGRGMRERWFQLAPLLAAKAEKALTRELGEALFAALPKQQLNMLRAGGVQFLKSAPFKEKADAALSAIVLPQLRTKDGRDWLKDNRQELRGWVQRANAEARDVLRAALVADQAKKSEERRYSADLLIDAWGLG